MNSTLHIVPMVQLSLLFFAHHGEHHETIQHTLRCTELIGKFGSYLGFNEEDVDTLQKGAMLHDIGKFFVSPDMLYASRRLTDQEFTLIKQHPVMGDLEGLDPVIRAMKEQHHEFLDGSGYPLRLSGHQIHPFAQILTIVDVYDALKHARSYKKAWTDDEIFDEMMRYRGTRFNPIYLDAFFLFLSKQ